MYVGVPKNYGGTVFGAKNSPKENTHTEKLPEILPHSVHKPEKKVCTEGKGCNGGCAEDKNPLSCLLNAFKSSKSGGIDTEDLLLLGLIVLLLGKEGNEDIVIILAMLLLM